MTSFTTSLCVTSSPMWITRESVLRRDVAAQLGAPVVNLVDAIIRAQDQPPQRERWGSLVVVDDTETGTAVEFKSMLSEPGRTALRSCSPPRA